MEWFVIGLTAGICLATAVSVMRSFFKEGRTCGTAKILTNGDYIRSLSDEVLALKIPTCPHDDIKRMKTCKAIRLNEDAVVIAVVRVRCTDRIIKDYTECKEKASVPGGPGKECSGCSLDIPGSEYCLLTMFPEIEEELEKRKAGELE